MNKNEDEKLIEEAAKAIYNDDPAWGYIYEDDHGERAADWDHLGEDLHEKFRSLAQGALAVFEKAHTPTDDEREALVDLVEEIEADWLQGEARPPYPNELAQELTRRGVRILRPVPSECRSCGHVLHALNGGPCGVIISDMLSEVQYCQCREAQGDPSDVQVKVVAQHIARAANDWTDIEGNQHEHGMHCTNWAAYTEDARAALCAARGVR